MVQTIFDYLYSPEKKLIAQQQTSHEINIFHVNFRFVQNIIQTINPVHFTKFECKKIACAVRFILEVVIIV